MGPHKSFLRQFNLEVFFLRNLEMRGYTTLSPYELKDGNGPMEPMILVSSCSSQCWEDIQFLTRDYKGLIPRECQAMKEIWREI